MTESTMRLEDKILAHAIRQLRNRNLIDETFFDNFYGDEWKKVSASIVEHYFLRVAEVMT